MLQFTPEDLIFNRKGELSSTQKESFKKQLEGIDQQSGNLVQYAITAGMIGTGVLIFRAGLSLEADMYIVMGAAILLSLYFFWLKKYLGPKKGKILAENKTIPIESIAGKMEFITPAKAAIDPNWACQFSVGGKTFYTDEQAFSKLENGQNYCIYFFQHSKLFPMVISWEKV